MRLAFLLALLFALPLASAELYLANSGNWETVYSAGILAAAKNKPYNFLTSASRAETIRDEIEPGSTVTVIESDTIPYVKQYAKRLEQHQFKADTILVNEDNANLDLAKRHPFKNFIIVDPTYGYDAISVAPYAATTDSYVLFATNDNIADIAAYLQSAQPEQLTIVGNVDESVKTTLAAHNPTIINEGSRFKNNIKLAELTQQQTTGKQIILTDGDFLEPDFFMAKQPVIFIGTDVPPLDTLRYLRNSPFQAAVVIGNQIVNSAEQIKDDTNLNVFIKFAKGISKGEQFYQTVQGLDTFPVPKIDLGLSIADLYYNPASQQLELGITNQKDARTYLTSSLLVQGDGQPIQTVGDEEPQLLQGQETRGLAYAIDLNEHLTKDLTADIALTYGASPDEFEKELIITKDIITEASRTDCDIDIDSAEYDKDTQRFQIRISSNDCYARITLPDVIINDQEETLESGTERVKGSRVIEIKQRLDEVDLADNPDLTVRVTYGGRATILDHVKEDTLPLRTPSALNANAILIGIIAILGVIILFLLWNRKR